MKLFLLSIFMFLGTTPLFCQTGGGVPTPEKASRSWEFGLGGTLTNWDRISITGFERLQNGYRYDLRARHLMGGVNLYIARELSRWFYLDFQGTLSFPDSDVDANGKKQRRHFYMGGLGLQFRFSPLFSSQYVEPYVRLGVNYLHKNFHTNYYGRFSGDPTGHAHWETTDTWNPNGRSTDKNSFLPVSLGAGVNAWLSNSLGLGLQGEYLMPLNKNLPRFAQLSLRLMWRIGGKSKSPAPLYVEVERPVERIVERVVERVVEKEVPGSSLKIYELFDNINFEFDKYTLTAASEQLLDEAAEILKRHEDLRFLITGFTDVRGSDAYNLTLSRNRARTVVEGLERRGVPSLMLKSRGVGKRAVSMPWGAANDVRLGDRKVTIERISNMAYWEALPKN